MHIAGLICGNSAIASLELNFPQEINIAVLLIPGFSSVMEDVEEDVLESLQA
jgi:hypothetical protein